MTNEELIALRDKYAEIESKHAKKKKKFVIITIIAYILAFILFIIAVVVNGDVRPYMAVFKILTGISIFFIAGGTVSLIFWIYHGVNEKSNQNKRDKVSYELTSNALKKYN